MEAGELNRIRVQLVNRRERLFKVAQQQSSKIHYLALLKEVDSALERIDGGTYGFCEVCNDPIEDDRLVVNPLICVCLDHLDEKQKRTLEEDLDLAQKIQKAMLPSKNLSAESWDIHFHYEPAGAVSGDYCDIILDCNSTYFILGDVSGKGIAASMLMSHIRALFHSLIPQKFGIDQLVAKINRFTCESNPSSHYITLLCVKAEKDGRIEVCNAGHLPPLLMKRNEQSMIDSTGIPIGLFCDAEYSVNTAVLNRDDIMFLYTDGLTESFCNDEEYGINRLSKIVLENHNLSPKEMTKEILIDLNKFIGGNPKRDDLTVMAIKKL
ncbi:MAG: SpoIIE family protein phosphatase [Ignavibacteriales bacterium]|nr:SpoIIE family protein phosphatase [Ignavibacteriales bacterium]